MVNEGDEAWHERGKTFPFETALGELHLHTLGVEVEEEAPRVRLKEQVDCRDRGGVLFLPFPLGVELHKSSLGIF